jgi:hypothetical protein
VPRAGGEHQCHEHDLRPERNEQGRIGQPPHEHAHQQHATGDGQHETRLRQGDESVLGPKTRDVVDDGRSADVRRPDPVVHDRFGASVREQRLERAEVSLLVEPGLEHHARPAARGQEQEEADGDQDEVAIDELDEPSAQRGRRFGRRRKRVAHASSFDADPSTPLGACTPRA